MNLARGPAREAICHKGYKVNGFIFHTSESGSHRKTQSSGVMVKEDSRREYYGVIDDIVELDYIGDNKIVMFKCLWWDVDSNGRGVKVDEHGITLINKSRTLKTNEPFVMASQCEQVFYVEDITNSNWLCLV